MTVDPYLTDIETSEHRDGTIRYELRFKENANIIDVDAWSTPEGIEVTYGGVPPIGSLRRTLDDRAYTLAVFVEMFDWYLPCIEHAIHIADRSMEFDDVGSWHTAVRWGLDDAADERGQCGVPEGTGRQIVYAMLEHIAMPESEWVEA